MDPQVWQPAVAVVVPLLGVVSSLLQKERSPRLYKNLRHASAALKDLPVEALEAREALQAVVVQQAELIREKEGASLSRKLNITNVVMSVIVSGAGGWGAIALLNWSTGVWGEPVGWLVVPVAVILGLFVILIIGASWATIYNPPKRAADGEVTE